ncbi:site-specific DNA-methyltransferase [Priestia endophytica]|uniref:site-specific DNA-methyltransferase n=1 Tax=Priestia endophytica TaxID=135735 RepID=UPI0018CCE5C4|nr:site-specific DNA-methyltransferase [Priestia endophytica]
MPVLDWIGKESVANYHKQIPFQQLIKDTNLSINPNESENMIINGDNLKVLKSLLPYYRGKIKCIYIDPPYNTGKENWIYNDNVNDPLIKEWIDKVVGKESEDLSRHDKWLCMMYPRLLLAKEFLSPDGVIFVSIDDNELHHLRILMDEIFKPKNMLACFSWQSDGNFDNQAKVKICHEYILAYTNDYAKFPHPPVIDPNTKEGSKLFNKEIRNTVVKNGAKNPVSPIIIPRGFPCDFKEGVIPKRDNAWPHYKDDLIVKDYMVQNEVEVCSGWSSKKILLSFIENNFESVKDSKKQDTRFSITKNGTIEGIKERKKDKQSHVLSVLRELGSTQSMSSKLASMGLKFDYPKPTQLLEFLLSMVSDKEFTVLDFFSGSGTTGEAVLNLNKKDNGNRKFILIEWKEEIVKEISAKRLEMVINGYEVESKNNEKILFPGTGGGFSFYELGEPLFDDYGRLSPDITYEQLVHHIYYTETKEPIPSIINAEQFLLGKTENMAIYFLYDKEKVGEFNTKILDLNLETLKIIKHKGPKVIFGSSCTLSKQRLKEEDITFKQVPYELKVR